MVVSLKRMFGRAAQSEAHAPNEPPVFRVPQNTRIYAIGDIHGHLDLLQGLLNSIISDVQARPSERTQLVFLGDYIDRGPASKEVIDCLLKLMRDDSAVFLRGNHEQVMLDFLADASTMRNWRHYGAVETLESYAVPTHKIKQGFGFEEAQTVLRQRLPRAHLEFLEATVPCHEAGDYYFCHAGIDPRRDLARQSAKDLLWIRREFLEDQTIHDKKIVHGHTPVKKPEIRRNRINVDTGAYMSGKLSCVVLEGSSVRFLSTNAASPPA